MAPFLSVLFNKSLKDAILPLDWVSAHVCPINKNGDEMCVSNYRPISLTCMFAKVLERIVHAKLYCLPKGVYTELKIIVIFYAFILLSLCNYKVILFIYLLVEVSY